MSTRGRKPNKRKRDSNDEDKYKNCANSKPTKSPKRIPQPLHRANLGGNDADYVERLVGEEWEGKKVVGARIAKPFGKKSKLKWFYGTVTKFEKASPSVDEDSKWHVTFDDGDNEIMNPEELSHWLLQYNKLWESEMASSAIPYVEESSAAVAKGKPRGRRKSNDTTTNDYYKVIWKLQKHLVEFSDHAFDECVNSAAVEKAKKDYRQAYEFDLPLQQKKDLFTSPKEANEIASDQFKMLAFQYQLEDDDRLEDVREEIVPILSTWETSKDDDEDSNNGVDGCKKWSWSYSWEDEHDNIFSCEGYIQVKQLL